MFKKFSVIITVSILENFKNSRPKWIYVHEILFIYLFIYLIKYITRTYYNTIVG